MRDEEKTKEQLLDDLRALRERLSQKESQHRWLEEGVRDHAVFTLDAAGIVTGWNAGAVRLYGHPERDIVGRYSYGRVIDVHGELIERWPGGAPDDPAVRRFAELRNEIEKIKTQDIVRAVSELAEMKQRIPDEYARLAPKLREIRDAAS